MKRIFLCLLSLLFSFLISAGAEAATINGIFWAARTDTSTPFVRIVIELSEAVKAEASLANDGKTLHLTVKDTDLSSAVSSSYIVSKQNVKSFSVRAEGTDTKITADMANALSSSDLKVFPLKPDAAAGRPHRLVIDIPSKASSTETSTTKTTAPVSEKKTTKSTSYSVTAKAKKVLKNKTICIDPGHGGADVGAIATLGGKTYYEKDINMSIAKPLVEMLKVSGAKVIMTHETDKDVYGAYADDIKELQARCNIGNKAGADIFVSIHIDSFSNNAVDGTTVYYYPKTSRDLLLAKYVHSSLINNLAIPDRGVRSNNLYVNVHTKMPSILLEMGFISNSHRLKMLTSSWGAKSIAQSIYKGIVDYFDQIS